MVRRAPSDATDDSQKENSGFPKKLQGKTEKVKRETLRSTRAGRVDSEDEGVKDEEQVNETQMADGDEGGGDEDAEGEDDDGEDGQEDREGSPKGRKRARANTNGDAHPSGSIEPKGKEKVRSKTLPRDVDGFIPGSIVRVQLKNFVTYDSVEFSPGPYLNMILGPNGTGKSSIACAICLGLNFPPSVLGRASELNSFVKIGTDAGHIEIELKGPKGQPNLVLRRTLSAQSKSSQFTINGAHVSGREVNTRMAELNVQVSNLCSFLPQDKVAEFARMSPQQLLRETQRAAGNENLTAWHDTLISAGRDLKSLQETLNTDREQLKTMQERNANLEREVRRYEERRAIEKEIELLELILPFKEYMEARERYEDTKKTQRTLHEKVKDLQAKHAPMIERQEVLEQEHKELDEQRNAKKNSTKAKFNHMGQKWKRNEDLEGEAENLKNQLESLKNREKKRARDIQTHEKNIVKMEHELANPPEVEDLEMLNNEMKHLKQENRRVVDRHTDLQQRQKACVEEESKQKVIIDRETHRLRQLDDASHRKFEELQRIDKDCYDAVVWIRRNRDRFKMEVLEPPMISVTIPDKRYAAAVESSFGGSQLKTIVAQCEEDYRQLNRLLIDTPEAVGRQLRLNTWYRSQETRLHPPPMTIEEMREAGFDGYLLDFVQCPEGLKWYLKMELQLHRTAVALDSNRANSSRAMDLCSRVGPSNPQGSAKFIVGTTLNGVLRSKYGRRLPQNSTSEIRPARTLITSAIDPAVKQGIERAIAEAQHNLEVCKGNANQLSVEDSAIQAEHRESKRKQEDLTRRREKVLDAQKRRTSTEAKLKRAMDDLATLRNAPSVDEERTRLKHKILDVAKKRVQIVKEYEKLIRSAIKEQEECTLIGLRYLQVGANKARLMELCQDADNEYQKALADFNRAHDDYEAAKRDSKLKLTVSKEKLDSVDPDVRTRFSEMESSGEANAKSADEVKIELDTQREKLDMNMHTNAGVVDTYKRRLREIEELSTKIEDREEKASKKERAIKIARDNWEPALNKLVDSVGDRFSAAFDRIGCAGEIKIAQHDDYERWAIDILVKFRDSEKLQLLTGERQSGGERSLTTIMYLMSLTAEARTPFSLVDEINQGMDARAERAVHNSLVEVTCEADSGQYFLITPKLLPDLLYHERMKVLCVNNGEWLPEETKGVGNLMGLINNFVQMHGGSRSNASV